MVCVCVSVCVHVYMWGEVYAFIILFEFVSYADRNEDMFQLISFFLAFYGFRLHREKTITSDRDDPIKKWQKL